MVARMKTTVELPDALVRAAKAVARERNSSLRELVETGLREQVDRLTGDAATPREFRFRTVHGRGVQHRAQASALHEHVYEPEPPLR